MKFEEIVKDLSKTIKTADAKSTTPYDSVAMVTRVDGDTAWVHIAGGVDETPVKLTIDCKQGDEVQVRVGGGRAWIVGNATAPPTDDTLAIEAKKTAEIANESAETALDTAGTAKDIAEATNQHFWTDDNGVHVASQSKNATAERNTLWNSLGMLFRKGSNVLLGILTGENPSVSIYDGQGNDDSNVVARFGATAVIGKENESRSIVSPSGYSFVSGEDVQQFYVGSSDGTMNELVNVSDIVGVVVKQSSYTFYMTRTPFQSSLINCPLYSVDPAQNYGGLYTFTAGTTSSQNITSSGSAIGTISYNASTSAITLTSTNSNKPIKWANISYRVSVSAIDVGALRFGTSRDGNMGAGSATFGVGLVGSGQSQTVIGRYNVADNNNSYALIVGKGTSATPSNAVTVDWSGNMVVNGNLTVPSPKNATVSGQNMVYDVGSFTLGGSGQYAGVYISTTVLRFTIPLQKPVSSRVNKVSISGGFITRCGGTSSGDKVFGTGNTVSASLDNTGVVVVVTFTSAQSFAKANYPASVQLSNVTVTFTVTT